MVNAEIIKERLFNIDENLKLLEELQDLDKRKFEADPKKFKLAERCLETSIQAILDICHHIILERNWRRPNDNRDAIEIIGMHGVIPEDFARYIALMAELWNILVHEYVKLDPGHVYECLNYINDFINNFKTF